MQLTLKTLLGLAAIGLATQAAAQITFYEGEGFRGRAFRVDKQVWNFDQTGFNDRARSAVVDGGRWEVCEDARFEGRCTVLRRGSYESLSGMGMDKRISSVRP
ncbi:MAG TPA: beta/gamma crystallin family protein, partial [Burkholderiales bacterium]|nr:beta/gamma crystallin family protein [Burkholderiales bacterium]